MLKTEYDVVIVGGSHAGLSAAMALGRMRRSVLICDDSRPRNQISSHANNIAGSDGVSPEKWRQQARHDLEKYKTIQLINATVHKVEKRQLQFHVELSSKEVVHARKIILAHGIQDKLPDVTGFQELWGKSVFHCPYCHGFEVQDQRLGVVGSGAYVEHMLPMILGLSKDVMVFTNGASDLSKDFVTALKKKQIPLIQSPIACLGYEGQKLQFIEFKNHPRIERDALFVGPQLPISMRVNFDKQLGLEKNEMGLYKVAEMGRTNIAGVLAAGDIVTLQQSVVNAVSSGQSAGAWATFELLSEDFHQF
ncbi:NAD(P)/FAD-dependent oxidoreductase [Pseudobdellovibrio exovorus]|uniref:FAD/NAD(P)-binding domain-containing protein n=1 Tax=Pseudobdellovibrio exovorus JSS TaxID=1184267 RepID=M4V584_9BACT|nr:NAD(P)/FAD-dependent oxidoreductase [Pseudobdellovibrio exovorus]AGH94477.1 hypothetical protein A11Q_257 [Pseudobdellovibrio exovorus JSS]